MNRSEHLSGDGLANSPPNRLDIIMTQVKTGDTVRVHYVGTLTDGTEFDNSAGRDPLEFTVGAGQIIPGFDNALPGMTVGEQKTVNVPAAEGYGDHDPNARQSVPRDQIPADIPLEVGGQLQMQTPEGRVVPITVVEVADDAVVLDANHPLAGKDLIFAIELVEIA
jgi:peptidylprolyl isomerase